MIKKILNIFSAVEIGLLLFLVILNFVRIYEIRKNSELTADIKAKTNELASIIRVNLHASDSAILAQDSVIRQLRSQIFVLRSKLDKQ